jgi:uncharacterized protein with HEPN domain
MASPSSNPFYSSAGGGLSAATGQQRLALDNLIRRELKVSDPGDPAQIAQALLERYKEEPRTRAITQEAQGLPFLLSAPSPTSRLPAPTSSDTEWQQAVDDINRDFEELTTSAILKDIKTELQGWASAIRTAITEGVNAARFALDTRQRDKVFAVRRTLGDYARLARVVGTLTPMLSVNYRKLAQSLDEAASVLLVIMGEALANVGFSGGRFLLQVPFSELQARRDAVIYALRNLLGTAQESYGNDWHRGIGAYRTLMQTLEDQGQGDLRSLLVENELVRVMDALIQTAGQGGVEGLRQLGVTAQIEVERFRRLIFIAQANGTYAAPPLAAFLDALLLFAQGFDASGGFRLLRVARPPILFYGLYGIGGMDNADQRLVRLIVQRGALAERLDCFTQRAVGTESEKAQSQIVLDKILYDVDRAIDLYAVGTKDFGDPEIRASAYADLIEEVLNQATMAGRIEVRGSGSGFITKADDTGTNDDSFFFAYLPISVPKAPEQNEPQITMKGEIVGRISDIVNVGPYTLGGLMLRENLYKNSRFALISLCPNRGVLFGSRSSSKGKSNWVPNPKGPAAEDTPYWLKLTWEIIQEYDETSQKYIKTVTVTGEKSEDGANWVRADDPDSPFKTTIDISNAKDNKPTTWYVGLAVTADILSGIYSPPSRWVSTAAFDHVSVDGDGLQGTGEREDDWTSQDIGINVQRKGGINFRETFFALTMREDYMLKEILNRIEELLSPEDSSEPWDSESENLADEEVAKMLRKKELCIQKDLENRWDNLVKTMAPSCTGYSSSIVRRLLETVVRQETGTVCPTLNVLVPPTQEENTQDIANILRVK